MTEEADPLPDDSQLERRIAALARDDWAPGLRLGAGLFAEELVRSRAHISKQRRLVNEPLGEAPPEPANPTWDAWRAMLAFDRQGDKEEATWLAFLATHFGRKQDEDPWRSTRSIYSGFGEGRLSWELVVTAPVNITNVCSRHTEECRHLKFANHRKFETPQVGHRFGIDAVLGSYVAGIIKNTGGSQATFFSAPDESAERRFERLMRELRFVTRFGRTARFDFLTLLGNLGVYELRPGRIYLDGATGPLRGARMMFGNDVDVRTLEESAKEMARRLDVPIQAVEDALCNWQKHPELGR